MVEFYALIFFIILLWVMVCMILYRRGVFLLLLNI